MFKRKNILMWALIGVIILLLTFAVAQIQLGHRANLNTAELNRQLREQAQTIAQLQAEIASQGELLRSIYLDEQPFGHGLTATQVKQELLQASDDILHHGVFGISPRFMGEDYITVSERYVLAQVADSAHRWQFELLLSYEVEGLGQFLDINWTLLDTDSSFINTRYFHQLTPRSLSTEESVTLRFYYYCVEIDPGVQLLPEAFVFVSEEVPGQYIWADFIMLMGKHTGISVWDWWFDDSKMYVDLYSMETFFFGMGSTGSFIRGTQLMKTLEALAGNMPGISYFEVLVGGEHDVSADKWSFGGVVRVD